MVDYSIIIPVYNGEKTILKLTHAIIDFFAKTKYSYNICLVYDCGRDNSWEEILKIKRRFPEIIKAIKLTKNFGQHNAIIAGIKHSNSRFIITMDEDLQHNPNEISKLIEEQSKGDYDLVYGKYIEQKHSFFRNLTSRVLKTLLKYGIPDLHSDYSAFRLIKTTIAKETLKMNNSYTFFDGYLSWLTTNVSSTNVHHNQRYDGKSSYTLKKLIDHSINIFVTFSNLPIRLVTIISIIVLLSSFGYSVYLIIRKILFNDLVAGYTSIMVILGFGIGLILFGIGVVGEYIYRISLKTTKRPNFVEKEIL